MKTGILALARKEYAKRHPDRDTRAMPVDDTLLALAAAVEGELDELWKSVGRLERAQTARDAE